MQKAVWAPRPLRQPLLTHASRSELLSEGRRTREPGLTRAEDGLLGFAVERKEKRGSERGLGAHLPTPTRPVGHPVVLSRHRGVSHGGCVNDRH